MMEDVLNASKSKIFLKKQCKAYNLLNQILNMKQSEIEVGFQFEHGYKGKGIVISRTPRTITVHFEKCTTKVTYRHKDAYFSPSDF